MKVTFIEHSSFMVEMEQNVLLFDYYQGEIPSFDGSKTLYVFASHSHADHYDPAIWKLKEQYKDIHYILSDDIKDNEGAVVMKAHEKRKLLNQNRNFKIKRHGSSISCESGRKDNLPCR